MQTGKWTPLTFVKDPYVRIHGLAPALNYGVQAFEGLKAFRHPGENKVVVFRPDRNAARLQHSAAFMSAPAVPADLFLDAVRAAVALNAEFVPPHHTGAAMYVRPQLYGSSAQLGLSPPEKYTFAVYVMPTGVYHGAHPVRALVLDQFDRAAPNGTGSAKLGGNYAPVLPWSEKARSEGYGITLHLDSKRHEEIDEFSTSGFIGAVVDGDKVTLVVPKSENIIESITSDSVLHIAHSFGWAVEKRPVGFPRCVQRKALTEATLAPDQILGAPRLQRSHGRRHRRRPSTYPLHHTTHGGIGPAVTRRNRQAAPAANARRPRGDHYLHPRQSK